MFRTLLLCCVWMLLGSASAASAQATITFAQALARARTDPPSVRVASAAVASARAAEEQARGAYFPTLSVTGQGTIGYSNFPVTPNENVDSTPLTASGTASAEWTLVDFGVRRSSVASAQASAESIAAGADASRRVALELAAEAFLRALSTRDLVEDGKLTLARRSEEAKSIAELVGAGVRPAVDRQRADIEVIAARYALEMRTVAEQAALAALAVSVGADPRQPLRPADAPSAAFGEPFAIEQAVTTALAERPEIKRDEAAVRSRSEDAENARSQRWPTLGALLQGTLARTKVLGKNDVGIDGSTYLASGGVVLRWNGLDATVWRKAQVADASLVQAQQTLGGSTLWVRAEAVAAALAVRQQRAALDQAEQILSAARVMREGQVERYKAGVASLLELLDAEQVEQTARVRKIEAARDYDLARMRLLSACGVLTQRFPQ